MRLRTKPSFLSAGVAVASIVATGFGCDVDRPAEPLAIPSFASVTRFSAKRFLTDEQIAKAALKTDEQQLADELLGLRPKTDEVATAVAPRPARRRRAPVRDVVEESWDDLEPAPGVLTDHAFQEAIHEWTGMRRCVAEATVRSADRSGALRVSLRIKGDGGVVSSKVIDTSNALAQAIAPCVERRARRIRFPAFGGDEDVTKEAKFVF